jgi:hypothetical protein
MVLAPEIRKDLHQARMRHTEQLVSHARIAAGHSDGSTEDEIEAIISENLQTCIEQLENAYDTFHHPNISDDKANGILRELFPG